MAAAQAVSSSASHVVSNSVHGEATLAVKCYSLLPKTHANVVASEPFEVAGHQWVLLFYPLGNHPELGQAVPVDQAAISAAADAKAKQDRDNRRAAAARMTAEELTDIQAQQEAAQQSLPHMVATAQRRQLFRDKQEQYWYFASVYVVRVGSGKQPQGIQQLFEDGIPFAAVCGYHSLTVVNHCDPERSLTLARDASHPAGALSIRCNEDPVSYNNRQERWGAGEFMKRSILEDPASGFLHDDTLLIRYRCELLMTHGGALSNTRGSPFTAEVLCAPPATLSKELEELLYSGRHSDFTICLEHPDYPAEQLQLHSMVLAARCPVLRRMLSIGMAEARSGRTVMRDVAHPAAKAMLHFIYTNALPKDLHEEWEQDPAMATHLLAAADMYQLGRLARICEQRLCRSIDVDNAAHLLALAEQHQAHELKRLTTPFNLASFVSKTAWEDEWHTTIKSKHKLTISNLSSLKGLQENECVASDTFEVAGHRWVLLFFPQGTSCDFVSQVPGQLPAAASKVQQASDTDAGIFINGPMPTAGVSSSVSAAARGQPAQAAAAAAARQEPSAQEQYMRMVLWQQRRHGDAAEQAAVREEIVRRGFTNARSVKVDHAAVFIARVGESKDPRGVVQVEQDGVEHRAVRMFCGFTLVNHKQLRASLVKNTKPALGPVVIRCTEQPSMLDMHCQHTRYGYRKLIKKTKLYNPANGWLKDDALEVRVELSVLLSAGQPSPTRVSPLLAEKLAVPAPSMAAEMAEILETGCGADLQLLVQHPQHVQQAFPVHRMVLQLRCPRLAQLAAAGAGTIVVDDIEPHVAKAMLHALYTDELPPGMQQGLAGQLLQAGLEYAMVRLAALCEAHLARCIRINTAVDILLLADSCRAQELKRVCMQFMAANVATLWAHASFQQLQQQRPLLLAELCDMLGTWGPVGSAAAQQLQVAAAVEAAKVLSLLLGGAEAQAGAAVAEQAAAASETAAAAPEAAAAAPEAAAAAAPEAGAAAVTGGSGGSAAVGSADDVIGDLYEGLGSDGEETEQEWMARLLARPPAADSAEAGSGDIYDGLLSDAEEAGQGEVVQPAMMLPQLWQLMAASSPCKRSWAEAVQPGDDAGSNGGEADRNMQPRLG
ncbi:hypothetical protein OEZ86_007748 [Tetradesmus obliquus]|nr:hypothetical protein OEZ86_007748 [Tetradesmus obliquus]